MSLFKLGEFTLSSGAKSSFKIECDSLTDDDWLCLAAMVAQMAGPFRSVEGVPRGGLKLAKCLEAYISKDGTGPLLLVDDVLTTGASMEELHEKHRRRLAPGTLIGPGQWIVGAVVFARGLCPPWVKAVFQCPRELWLAQNKG